LNPGYFFIPAHKVIEFPVPLNCFHNCCNNNLLKQLSGEYLPHVILAGTAEESDLPLFTGRFLKGKTRIFVCRNKVCQAHVEDPEDAKAIYHQQIEQA
jgi:uncharacterized protein YyaL (SSP411 family)